MSQQMTTFNASARPNHLAPLAASASVTDLTTGVAASYPVLRMKGKVWSLTMNGQTRPLTTRDGYAIPAMRVVLVKANPFVSKTFYRDGYTDGADAPPDCWSFDGEKPDVAVKQPCAATCASCPNNRLGSKISESGSRVKACPDVRRIAIMEPQSGTLMLLRLPYTSMKSLAAFANDLSQMPSPPGYNEIVTEMTFDLAKAHPEIIFKPIRWLEPDEAAKVQEALASPTVDDILRGGAAEHGTSAQAAAPAAPAPAASLPPRPAPAAATAAAPAPAPAAPPAMDMSAFQQQPATPAATAPAPRAAQQAAAPIVVDSGSLEDALAQALQFPT